MFKVISFLIHGIQPLLIPICFVVGWTLIILVVLSLWAAVRDSVTIAKQMYQIPCTGCQYFTDNYRLKCTVHPSIANTEEAINCSDYQPKTNHYLY